MSEEFVEKRQIDRRSGDRRQGDRRISERRLIPINKEIKQVVDTRILICGDDSAHEDIVYNTLEQLYKQYTDDFHRLIIIYNENTQIGNLVGLWYGRYINDDSVASLVFSNNGTTQVARFLCCQRMLSEGNPNEIFAFYETEESFDTHTIIELALLDSVTVWQYKNNNEAIMVNQI